MPTPFDLLSEQLDEDPGDELRLDLGQNQGSNLAGSPQPVAPSPNVPGPLAAISQGKPRIRQLATVSQKPRIRIKGAISKKPRIRQMGIATNA